MSLAKPEHRLLRVGTACLLASLALTTSAWRATGAEPLSHLAVHALALPPIGLTRPLVNGDSQAKGMNPDVERTLLSALNGAGLSERVLRVAVAAQDGQSAALVKVQAGDAQSRLFSLAAVEQDALLGLRVAFGVSRQIGHVDFWAVVPEIVADGTEWHRPVFSVAAQREVYQRLVKGPARPSRELLAGLSAVRYDPVFTRYATDWATAKDDMPRTAYTFPRLAEAWQGLAAEGVTGTADLTGAEARVRAILGGVPDGGKVALTIDDGPHPLITPLVLDVLRRERVKATFFVVGEKAEEFPGLIREIAREGHELGNHTYSHRRFSTLSPAEVYAEIRGCARIVATLTGTVMTYMRPPGGDYTVASLEVAERLGLVTTLWTHNTGDWKKPEVGAIAHNATSQLGSGDIILMHQGDLCSVQALPLIIAQVRARRLVPARLCDIIANGTVRKLGAREALGERGRLRLTE